MSETKPRSLIDEYLAEKEANGKIRENNVLFVTDLTKECLRNAYYDITIDTPATPKQLRIFASGNMIEEFWVNEVLRNSKEIKDAQEQLKELKGPYSDMLKALKLKMSYIHILMKEQSGEASSEEKEE